MKNGTLFFMVLLCYWGYGFNLNVIASDETCTGNGMLTFSITNDTSSDNIVFFIYKLPNVVTPISVVSATSISGLVAGEYLVVAKSVTRADSPTAEMTVRILDMKTTLAFNVATLNQACSLNSSIIVNVTSGIPETYEIFSGPVIFPPQTSNIFNNLPIGTYKVRVIDRCGIGMVVTHTITINQTGLNLSGSTQSLIGCHQATTTSTITPNGGTIIAYPLTLQYQLHLPNGTTQIINQQQDSGNLQSLNVTATIPIFPNQTYSGQLNITDSCNNNYSFTQTFNGAINFNITPVKIPCAGYYLELSTDNLVKPFTIEVNNAPAGFTPIIFNSNFPGPYAGNTVLFGSTLQALPYGVYDFTITDACGNSISHSINLIESLPQINAIGLNDDCRNLSGVINASIPGNGISTAIVTAAPSQFNHSLPFDVSSMIDPILGTLKIWPVPAGNYEMDIINACTGQSQTIQVTVPTYEDKGLIYEIRNGCNSGRGGVKIQSNNGPITEFVVESSPIEFSVVSDWTQLIVDGVLYLVDIPQGNYSFKVMDSCGFKNLLNIAIEGYLVQNSYFNKVTNCGSFDLEVEFVSNAIKDEQYWLQKLINPTTQQWGHPITGNIYLEGSSPTTQNGISLTNHATNYNFSINGTFRIVRSYTSFNSVSDYNSRLVDSMDKKCVEYLNPNFDFNESLEIINAYSSNCSTNLVPDVIIHATGTSPLHYTIVSKNNQPFFIDNSTQNFFTNLSNGIYTFIVEDPCGNRVTRILDISALPKIVALNPQSDLVQCQRIITGNEVFDLIPITANLLGVQSTSQYTIEYYTSLSDAQAGLNKIINISQFNPPGNPFTVFVRAFFNAYPNCFEIASFDLIVGQEPFLNLQSQYVSCENQPITLNASVGNPPTTTYLWSSGETSPSIIISESGKHHVKLIAKNYYGTPLQECTTVKEVDVIITEKPKIEQINITDWSITENSITVLTENNEDNEYSIDGVNFQIEPTFNDLTTGIYNVTVRDIYGCGTDSKEVALLNYPRYFTPNEDGFHDYWKIPYMEKEPNLNIMIYDRYGKLVKSFDSKSLGWDGNYNGKPLPATDYWFVANREDGKIFKGHFALKR